MAGIKSHDEKKQRKKTCRNQKSLSEDKVEDYEEIRESFCEELFFFPSFCLLEKEKEGAFYLVHGATHAGWSERTAYMAC